jgi:acyl-CoA thioesterase-1
LKAENKSSAMQYAPQIGRGGFLFALVVLGFFAIFTGVARAQIVAFGASNVSGEGVSADQAWPALLERLLRDKGYKVRVDNEGVAGDTTKDMLDRLDSAIPAGTTIVILDYSGGFFNNRKLGIPYEQGVADMKGIGNRLRARGIKIVPEMAVRMPENLRQADHVHLTAEGHRQFAAKLLPWVIAALGNAHES